MIFNNKLTKQIDETRYLTAENTWRYRSIMRYFYHEHEKMKFWLYKEEIYEELQKHELFTAYTLEQCKQDLDVLLQWKNLNAMQDTTKVATVEEFKNKQYRYQMSEYSVHIERLTIRLENLHVESASLEPSLLERIRLEISKLPQMVYEPERQVGIWWNDLNNDFKRLNQNYQDYVRELYSLKAEELMKTTEFLVFKDKFIDYLRDFIKGLQAHSSAIEALLLQINLSDIDKILEKVIAYELSIPRIDTVDLDLDIKDNVHGRWESLKGWFIGSESEAVKLLTITNEIIRKLTRFASQIVESRNSAANRKEEYRKLCELFINCQTIEEAHLLSSVTFGIVNMKHIKANVFRKTESINSSIWEEEPTSYTVKPRIRQYREKANRTPIVSHEDKKKAMFEKIIKARMNEQKIMQQYIKGDEIDFAELPTVSQSVRLTLLKWLSLGIHSVDQVGKTEDGRVYRIIKSSQNKRCILKCVDGDLDMPHYIIQFERLS